MARYQERLQASQASRDGATAMLANAEARRPTFQSLDDDVFRDGSSDESSERKVEEVEENVYHESSDQEMEDNDDPNDPDYTS